MLPNQATSLHFFRENNHREFIPGTHGPAELLQICFAGLALSELPAFLSRANRLAYRDLDDTHRNELAGVPADRFCAAFGCRRVLGSDAGVFAIAACRSNR